MYVLNIQAFFHEGKGCQKLPAKIVGEKISLSKQKILNREDRGWPSRKPTALPAHY